MNRLLPLFALMATLIGAGGCRERPRPDDVPVVVSAIGGPARPGDPNRGPLDAAQAALMTATAQGLVRFDANGGIEPGLAERWIVIDGASSYIFRLREAEWPDGEPVTADDVVAVLRRAIADASRNRLKQSLDVIDEIVAMTPQVIEVRLHRPRPDLLKLFAQPELSIFRARDMGGTGPYRVVPDRGGGVLLRPVFDPTRVAEEGAEEPTPEEHVRLYGERAALAIARFVARRSDLVLGGTFRDWPIVTVAGVAPTNIRLDAAPGLFGLAVVGRDGVLAEPDGRAAIAMAIDRQALTNSVHPDWQPVETVLPGQYDSATAPAAPGWEGLSLDTRREQARAWVQGWRRSNGTVPVVRIALPQGPGATRIWGQLAFSMASVGVRAERVGIDQPADLVLVDQVAPYDSARWFLYTACRRCSDAAATLIEAARDAPTLEARAQRIAEADAALTADSAFIPIAQPLRWSIVAMRLGSWQGNPRAWHPLNHLRNP